MTETQLQQAGYLYKLDETLYAAHLNAKRLTRLLNGTTELEVDRRRELAKELFGTTGQKVHVEPPFHCDFGYNIHVGEGFYCNYDCIFVDVGPITIGDNVMIGPRVSIYSANHPIDPKVRALHHDHGIPVRIGHDVWIGGGTVICPGASIGDNTVIGAGSVVTRDIPANVVAAGNPCRVIRPITEKDTEYWQNQLALYRELCDNPKV